ncbi:serine/threonine protein kinase [Pseudoalteromonas piratica]|uniref:Stress response kinase A n=1 Tax=Pseudoalteromonas piratica TaxID=1348114 RepID=A0A0A7ED79_9GAMM|nr:serine/threonine protein kinase [Pseudoalteromonas piratica]AIY64493.1 serine/threonine protein kinase [Pseudoalteromonas piratica]
MSAFDFSDLTPDRILDAIESIGVYPTSGLLALNSYENRVYQFVAEDSKRYVVKFYRPERWRTEQILEEHDFSFELLEGEVPVVAPIKRDNTSLFEYQGYRFALFPSVGGRTFEADNYDHLEVLGRFIGRLHNVSSTKPFTVRPTISSQEFLHDARTSLIDSNLITPSLETPFITVLDQVIALAGEKYQPNNVIRLHGDCHIGNILWTGNELTFVDLDDARQGPAVQDLWMMLSGDEQEQRIQMDTLLCAYDEFSSFDLKELHLIEPLRALRMINYMGWLAKRWKDLAFQRNFSWFASDKYWEQQILSLKEQLAALHEAPLKLLP